MSFPLKHLMEHVCLAWWQLSQKRNKIWESGSEEGVREWLWEVTTCLGKTLWTVIVGNTPALARRLITWSNKTFPSVMSLICGWRNNKYTFDVQLFCSRLTSVWIVACLLPGIRAYLRHTWRSTILEILLGLLQTCTGGVCLAVITCAFAKVLTL